MRAAAIAFVVVGALLLASCASAPSDSGIKGMVTIGPTSPVEQPGETNVAPYSARILIKNTTGRRIAEVESGEDGRFSVNLAPGRYVLEPQSGAAGLPVAEPQDVTVKAHRFTEVSVAYDSGIR